MTTARVSTFNVNQFQPLAHQKADLLVRMDRSDILVLQETVHLDVSAFAAAHGWEGFQVHNGDNDGHANTAVMWRPEFGPAAAKYLVDLGRANTRERYLTAVDLPASGFGSGHIFPERDKAGIPGQLDALHTWRRAHQGTQVLGFDRNQLPPERLEAVTGMKWFGVGIDGFLVSPDVKVRRIHAFPKGFSDHPGVHAEMTLPDPETQGDSVNRIKQSRSILREALRVAEKSGRQERASRIRRALNALAVRVSPPKVVVQPLTYPAIAAARVQSHDGPPFGTGLCLQRVRMCFDIPALASDAIGAWNIAKTKHSVTDPLKVPRGYPIFWRGGSSGHGHIAISTGDGHCWSTDIRRPGFFDYVPIIEIHTQWGLTFLGWTEDLNGHAITYERH